MMAPFLWGLTADLFPSYSRQVHTHLSCHSAHYNVAHFWRSILSVPVCIGSSSVYRNQSRRALLTSWQNFMELTSLFLRFFFFFYHMWHALSQFPASLSEIAYISLAVLFSIAHNLNIYVPWEHILVLFSHCTCSWVILIPHPSFQLSPHTGNFLVCISVSSLEYSTELPSWYVLKGTHSLCFHICCFFSNFNISCRNSAMKDFFPLLFLFT